MYYITYSIHVHHIHYIHDIVSTMYDNTTLCVVDTKLGICVTSFALQMISHPITPNHNIYDVTCPSGMTSHPMCQTLHPLYLCHHNLSTDIIPTFVWHHTQYMRGIICTIYSTISSPYVITLLYLSHHNHYIWNHIQYVGLHIHYTCDITATNLCHHSQSIENITHTLHDIKLR